MLCVSIIYYATVMPIVFPIIMPEFLWNTNYLVRCHPHCTYLNQTLIFSLRSLFYNLCWLILSSNIFSIYLTVIQLNNLFIILKKTLKKNKISILSVKNLRFPDSLSKIDIFMHIYMFIYIERKEKGNTCYWTLACFLLLRDIWLQMMFQFNKLEK